MSKIFVALGGSIILSACVASGVVDRIIDNTRECLALVRGTVYVSPTDQPIQGGVVLIEDGKIVAVGNRSSVRIPGSAQLLDCSGLTVTAGFWNSHVHFAETKWADAARLSAPAVSRQLEDMLTRYGFTSVFDLSSEWENTRRLRDRIESGEVLGPRIFSTGEGLVPPDGNPPQSVWDAMGFMRAQLPEVADARQATTVSRALLSGGADGIKLFVSSQGGDQIVGGAMRAAAAEAHRSNKPVFAHPNTGADILVAVRGGVDVIAHTTPSSEPWDETLLTAMKRADIALTPTLTLWKKDTAVDQLRAWHAIGGEVLFGTDLGVVGPDPSEEYASMAAAGMDFSQILASLTVIPAERFAQSQLQGRIAKGYQADLVVFRGDPSVDIRSLANVQFTIRSGRIIYQSK